MLERIFGLEFEYSLTHHPLPGNPPMDSEEVAKVAVDAAHAELREIGRGSFFWPNGSKLYFDVGHVEWASPECRSAREAVLYDKAGERFLRQIADAAERRIRSMGRTGKLFVAKNNVDAYGNSFGSHENYLVQRQTDILDSNDEFFDYLIRNLIPFLVTRIIVGGNGHIGNDGRFQLSQRAEFITDALGGDTRAERSIINTRDEPHADSDKFRRLHLILGDANMCEWAGFLKLGSTGVVLEMIEDVFLDNPPALEKPVEALHQISKDLQLERAVRLRNGKRQTAIEIQAWYCETAERFYRNRLPSEETRLILKEWKQTLESLARNPAEQAGRLDWVTKQAFFPHCVAAEWGDPRMRKLNFEYHSIRPEDSAYYDLVASGGVDCFLTAADIEVALSQPPPFSRARIRGYGVSRGADAPDWTAIKPQGMAQLRCMDPFDWCSGGALDAFAISPSEAERWLHDGLSSSSPEVRVQAVGGLAATGELAAGLAELALEDPDPRVRAAALGVLDDLGAPVCAKVRQACRDPHFLVRLKADELVSNRRGRAGF